VVALFSRNETLQQNIRRLFRYLPMSLLGRRRLEGKDLILLVIRPSELLDSLFLCYLKSMTHNLSVDSHSHLLKVRFQSGGIQLIVPGPPSRVLILFLETKASVQ
jgi:hypothetical protein